MHRFLAALLAFLPVPALAHAFLEGAQPRVGSELGTPPARVVLHFSQGVEPAFSRIEVTDSNGAAVTAGAAQTMGDDPTRLAVKLNAVGAGVYTVIWHVTSVDTHKTQGKFHFTVTK